MRAVGSGSGAGAPRFRIQTNARAWRGDVAGQSDKGADREAGLRWRDLLLAPVCEAALVLVAALAGWLVHKPLIFASLGPTAFEQIETPRRPSARPYNIIAGHLIAILAGFAALWLTGAWKAPVVSANGFPLVRVGAAVLSALLTVFLTLLARATQPAALATNLLISLGLMQTGEDAAVIVAGVLLMAVVGEPLRRWRAHGAAAAHPEASS